MSVDNHGEHMQQTPIKYSQASWLSWVSRTDSNSSWQHAMHLLNHVNAFKSHACEFRKPLCRFPPGIQSCNLHFVVFPVLRGTKLIFWPFTDCFPHCNILYLGKREFGLLLLLKLKECGRPYFIFYFLYLA